MEPRKQGLRRERSTSVPVEYLKQMEEVFTDTFPEIVKGKKLYIEGRIFTDEIILSVGFKPTPEGLRQINFEASVDHKKTDVIAKLDLCSEALASVMEQYSESEGQLELPAQWKSFQFNKNTVWLQSSGRNTELEAEANRLLGVDPDNALFVEADGDDLLGEDEDFEKILN